tara:strand:+ start:269 stop:379 length:111 start_codon:yes stop_codon:yes gene_type:complete
MMKKILISHKNSDTTVQDIQTPSISSGHVLVKPEKY